MAHLLYGFKILMFGRIQEDDGQFKLAAKEEHGLYVSFSALSIAGGYIQGWFVASMPTLAPNNDLLFLYRLQEYSAINKVLSDGAVQK